MKIPFISAYFERKRKKYLDLDIEHEKEEERREKEAMRNNNFTYGMNQWFNGAEPILKNILRDSPNALDGFDYVANYTTGSWGSRTFHTIFFQNDSYNVIESDEYDSRGCFKDIHKITLDEIFSKMGNFFRSGYWTLGHRFAEKNKLIELIEKRTGRNLEGEVDSLREKRK